MIQGPSLPQAPQQIDLLRQWLPIGISLLSFALASLALGWNIYRDVILKARVRVHFSIVRVVSEDAQRLVPGERLLSIAVTNHGPGQVKITLIVGRYSVPFWKRPVQRPQHFVILKYLRTNPANRHLPQRLDVGDSLTLFLPYDERCFLSDDASQIGVSDSYGRYHYAPRKDVREAGKQFSKDFGAQLEP